MRPLSSTLLAAQRSASAKPYVKVEVLDMLAGVVRPTFTQLYSGSETEFHHAATMPGDGSLLRARVDPSPGQLYVQRVVNPGPSSDFGSWTLLDTAYTSCNIALCSRGASAYLFVVDSSNGKTIYAWRSSNYGATWARETVATPVVLVRWLTADINLAGVAALFYGTEEQKVYSTRRIDGQWTTPLQWPNSVLTLKGMACAYQGDWNLVIAGTETVGGDYLLWTCIYGDGGSVPGGNWTSLQETARAKSDSGVEYSIPFLAYPDVFRMSYVEKYAGSFTYTRPFLATTLEGSTFVQNLWREATPFNLSSTYGLALAHGGGNLWLSTSSKVWNGPLGQGTLDVSADVLGLAMKETAQGTQALLTLRNDDGRYNTLGSGANAPLQKGSEVRISPGYLTSAGLEVSVGSAYWITGFQHLSRGGKAHLLLSAADAWWLLEGWKARRQYSWAVGQASIQTILASLLTRVGLPLTVLSSSTTFTSHKPALTVHPGESAATAVRRLLAQVPDVLFFRGHRAYVKQPTAADATDYAYGISHPLLEGRYGAEAFPFTQIQVYGAAGMAETCAWSEVPLLGPRVLQVHDLNLDTQAKAQDRGQHILRHLTLEGTSGEVAVPPNCGQELYDVIEVTDSRAGLSAARRRVLGITLEYHRGERSRYTQRLVLGGV